MDITIKPGAVIDDAVQIDYIVSSIDDSMKTLDSVIKETIPAGVETSWSSTIRENWENFYNNEILLALEEMKVSAENLRLAIEKALTYDKE